ncbi:ferritin-like domain-containing protein [Variovorax sp. RT4R15]|uniref:ferritin-like domain-containing protein n=1 Tax=Variovorax sp. RT4R15 TaxID=3443737 RepID=UPI003F471490
MSNENYNPIEPDGAVKLDDEQTLGVLNDLLENARDGEYGFRACAQQVENAQLKQVFNDRAIECRRAADELIQWITRRGGAPADGGSATGALHRGWVNLKGAVGANSEVSMLEECERGEDAALARYRKALKSDSLPADVRSLIERQMLGAQRNHDQIKALRDQAKAVS